METREKALALLKQFVSETPAEELASLLNKHKNSAIEGPTYSQYLVSLQNSYESINWYSLAEEVNKIDLSSCNVTKMGCDKMAYVTEPPPKSQKIISNNQDSTIVVESFFLL